MDTQTVWEIILADLEMQISKASFKTFLYQTRLLELTDDTATIGCQQPMLIKLIEKRFAPAIKKLLDNYTKNNIRLVFKPLPISGQKKLDGPLFDIKPMNNLVSPKITNIDLRLNLEYTFENFAVSSSNQMAYAAATAVAKTPGTSYNPLFLYGGVGVGKTHLMQAIGQTIIKKQPHIKLLYCTGEEFTNEIIEAIGNKTTVAFKKKYRNLKLLLIDDIQFIAGKNAVQEEFFHTFNAIQQTGGQIVLTSDRTPDEINKLEARLRSRFEGGLIIDIGPPDFELRTAILLIKAKQRGVEIPIEAAKLLSANHDNPRSLEGALIRVITESQIKKIPIDEELIKNILGKTIKETPKKSNIKPDDAINTVASYYNLKLSQIKGVRRDRMLSRPRQILYYILRTELNIPLVEIGNILGGRDHTTIIHGVKKISALMVTDEKIRSDILGIKNRF